MVELMANPYIQVRPGLQEELRIVVSQGAGVPFAVPSNVRIRFVNNAEDVQRIFEFDSASERIEVVVTADEIQCVLTLEPTETIKFRGKADAFMAIWMEYDDDDERWGVPLIAVRVERSAVAI